MSHHLMGVSEIADLLGLTRQRVHQLRQEAGFPAPTSQLAQGPVWESAEVEKWARKAGRLS